MGILILDRIVSINTEDYRAQRDRTLKCVMEELHRIDKQIE